jgi:CRP-like cAMP-binding protein
MRDASDQTLTSLLPHLDCLNVERGQTLNTDRYIYFPVTARLGIRELVQDNLRIEVTPVYPEEATTIVQHLEQHNMRTSTHVVKNGMTFRFLIDRIVLMQQSISIPNRLDEFNQLAMSRVLKTLTCSLEHRLDLRVARYLLTQYDKHLEISQQDVANALGCRREGVTDIFKDLTRWGAIVHTRGHVTLNEDRLMRLSCGCEKHIFPRF